MDYEPGPHNKDLGPEPGPTLDDMLMAAYPFIMPLIIMGVGILIAVAVSH